MGFASRPDKAASPRFFVNEITNVEEKSFTPKSEAQCESRDDISNGNLCYRNENRSGRSSPMPMNYSPLFFTMRDFESVMECSGKSDKSLSEQFDSIVTKDESSPTLITSFIDNDEFDDPDDDENDERVCFKVTTTNVPFEKCLGDWRIDCDSADDDFHPDHYIFEDYIDRRKKPAFQSAPQTFIFDDETFGNFDAEEPSGLRSATKVRFVIESPTPSTPERDFIETFESLSNIESVVADFDNVAETSVVVTEINENSDNIDEAIRESSKSDEFGDVPFSSAVANEFASEDIENRVNDDSDEISRSNETDERNNKPVVIARPRSTPSPRFTSPKKSEFKLIDDIDDILIPKLPPTHDPREEGFVKKKWDEIIPPGKFNDDPSKDLQGACEASSGNRGSSEARNAFISGKLNLDSREYREIKSSRGDDEKSGLEKRNIFIDAKLRYLIDDETEDWRDWSSEEDEAKESDASQHSKFNPSNLSELVETDAAKKMLNSDTRREEWLDESSRPRENKELDEKKLEEEAKTIGSSRPLYLGEISRLSQASRDDTTSVKVTACRNSFLENMLTEEEFSGNIRADYPCSIIATHPKPPTIEKPRDHEEDSTENRDTGQTMIIDDREKKTCEKQSETGSGTRWIGQTPKFGESLGEAKNDVLNELLSNFSSIKLKSVGDKIREESEEKICDETKIEEKMDADCEIEKSFRRKKVTEEPKNPMALRPSTLDISVRKNSEESKIVQRPDDESAATINERTISNVKKFVNAEYKNKDKSRRFDNRDMIISVDECAIDRNTIEPAILCNNNDNNNPMKPVDVSNDQKLREIRVSSTIVPGSVRSFVELYEIQSEKTSEYSKSNISVPVEKTRLSKRQEMWNNNNNNNNNQRNDKTSVRNDEFTRPETMFVGDLEERKNDYDENVSESNVNRDTGDNEFFPNDRSSIFHDKPDDRVPLPLKRQSRESCLKMANLLGVRCEEKKTVTFYNDCDTVRLEKNGSCDEATFVGTSIEETIARGKTPKRRAPERPIVESRSEERLECSTRSIVERGGKFDSSKAKVMSQCEKVDPTPLPRTAVSSNSSETRLTAMEKDRAKKSGITSSTTNTDEPRFRQPYVFYCRV